MHPEERALLNAIFAAPDDDAPRLIYADWLDEHEREMRAEFIRLQCEPAKTMTQEQIARLAWLFPRLRVVAFGNQPYGFTRRGFLTTLNFSYTFAGYTGLISRGSLLSCHPITRLEVSDKQPEGILLTGNPPIEQHRWYSARNADGGFNHLSLIPHQVWEAIALPLRDAEFGGPCKCAFSRPEAFAKLSNAILTVAYETVVKYFAV